MLVCPSGVESVSGEIIPFMATWPRRKRIPKFAVCVQVTVRSVSSFSITQVITGYSAYI